MPLEGEAYASRNLYSTSTHAFSGEDITKAEAYATQASRALRMASSVAEPTRRSLWHNMRMNADNAACSLSADSQYVELAVEVFAMLADATRVRIILALRDGEMAVGALAEVVGKSPAAVSQHLAKMRLARMVSARQDGTRVLYRLANEHARQLVVDAVFQAEHALGGEPAHHRRDRKAAS